MKKRWSFPLKLKYEVIKRFYGGQMDKVRSEKKQEGEVPEPVRREKSIKERVDEEGERWEKKYFGGGPHFEHWLKEYEDIYGEENVETEEIDSFGCYGGDDKMYRIWVKKTAETREIDELFRD